MEPEEGKGVLVLGLGNYLLSDEGVGVHVANELLRMSLPAGVEVIDGGTGGFELLRHAHGKRKVIIIDCLNAVAPAGTIARLELDELESHVVRQFSPHQGGVHDLVAFLRALSPAPEVLVYGIVPAVADSFSTDLSPAVQAQIPRLISLVLEGLKEERTLAADR